MSPRLLLMAALGLTIGARTLMAAADSPDGSSSDEGKKLAAEIRSAAPTENSEITGMLILSAKAKKPEEIPVTCLVQIGAQDWKTVYQTASTATRGAEKLVIVHRPEQPNQYFYAQAPRPGAALPEAKSLDPAEADIPFAGSDFSLTDLGLEFLHWPEQIRLKGEMRLSQPCYVLDSRNPKGKEIVRVKSWIDKESNGILVAEAMNKKNSTVKEFNLHGSSFKKIKGRWQLERMEIRSPKKDTQTTLKFNLPKD